MLNETASADVADDSLLYEFVTIPSWKVYGMILDQTPPHYGSEACIRVLVQTHPERPERAKWFHLEPGQYTLD